MLFYRPALWQDILKKENDALHRELSELASEAPELLMEHPHLEEALQVLEKVVVACLTVQKVELASRLVNVLLKIGNRETQGTSSHLQKLVDVYDAILSLVDLEQAVSEWQETSEESRQAAPFMTLLQRQSKSWLSFQARLESLVSTTKPTGEGQEDEILALLTSAQKFSQDVSKVARDAVLASLETSVSKLKTPHRGQGQVAPWD